MANIKDLISQVKTITISGLPFMEGREKGEMKDLIDSTVNIVDYGYMDDNGKEYVAFVTKEDDSKFYFGGQVLTDSLKKVDEIMTDTEITELLETGIEVSFETKKSKNKREYTKCTFFPNK